MDAMKVIETFQFNYPDGPPPFCVPDQLRHHGVDMAVHTCTHAVNLTPLDRHGRPLREFIEIPLSDMHRVVSELRTAIYGSLEPEPVVLPYLNGTALCGRNRTAKGASIGLSVQFTDPICTLTPVMPPGSEVPCQIEIWCRRFMDFMHILERCEPIQVRPGDMFLRGREFPRGFRPLQTKRCDLCFPPKVLMATRPIPMENIDDVLMRDRFTFGSGPEATFAGDRGPRPCAGVDAVLTSKVFRMCPVNSRGEPGSVRVEMSVGEMRDLMWSLWFAPTVLGEHPVFIPMNSALCHGSCRTSACAGITAELTGQVVRLRPRSGLGQDLDYWFEIPAALLRRFVRFLGSFRREWARHHGHRVIGLPWNRWAAKPAWRPADPDSEWAELSPAGGQDGQRLLPAERRSPKAVEVVLHPGSLPPPGRWLTQEGSLLRPAPGCKARRVMVLRKDWFRGVITAWPLALPETMGLNGDCIYVLERQPALPGYEQPDYGRVPVTVDYKMAASIPEAFLKNVLGPGRDSGYSPVGRLFYGPDCRAGFRGDRGWRPCTGVELFYNHRQKVIEIAPLNRHGRRESLFIQVPIYDIRRLQSAMRESVAHMGTEIVMEYSHAGARYCRRGRKELSWFLAITAVTGFVKLTPYSSKGPSKRWVGVPRGMLDEFLGFLEAFIPR